MPARRRQRETGSLSLHRDRRRETHTAAEAERRRLLQAIGEAAAVDGPEAAAGSGGFVTLRDELLMKEAARVIADFIAYRTHPERNLVRN